MPDGFAISLTHQMLWQAIQVSTPVILTALLSGIAVSLFQVITQVQDATVSAVPKLLACVVVLLFGGEWMLRGLMRFAILTISRIPEVAP